MKNHLKLKDVMLVALLTAVYIVLYMVTMALISLTGPFGHSISPGMNGLISGIVLYFMARKVGKMWQFTLMTALLMGVFSLMGGGYLPWLISSIVTAIIADILVSRSNKPNVIMLAVASGIMHVGQAWGAIIPANFFLESYKETWMKRGQTAEDMDAYIKYTVGSWGLIATVVVFLMAFVGIFIGYIILKKHFKEEGNDTN